MKKIKVTADAVLSIIQGIFNEPEINIVIDDSDAPPSWKGKTVSEILNVEYYTFKHRPRESEDIINKAMAEKGEADMLAAASRAFCLLALTGIERLFSKDVDMSVCTASLEYYIQTSKVKLLESLIEDANLATSGLRIPVTFGEGSDAQTRQAVITFDRPNVGDIQTASNFSEVALVSVDMTVLFYPDVASYSDYSINAAFTDETGNTINTAPDNPIPLTSVSVTYTATQQAVPLIGDSSRVGNINLSGARGFVFVFDGYNNPWINYITDKTLNNAGFDNNQVFAFTIRRKEKSYTHLMIIKDHQITTNADTGNEVHTVTVSTEGINGAA